MRQPQGLQAFRASASTAAVLDRWLYEFKQFLFQHNLLDKPSRIWKCEEGSFPLCPKSSKVHSGHAMFITSQEQQATYNHLMLHLSCWWSHPTNAYLSWKEIWVQSSGGWSGRCLLRDILEWVDDTGALLWMDQQALSQSSPSWMTSLPACRWPLLPH